MSCDKSIAYSKASTLFYNSAYIWKQKFSLAKVLQLEFCTYFTSLPCPLRVRFVRPDSRFSTILSGQMLVSVHSEQAAVRLSVWVSKVSNSSQVDNGWQPDWTSHVTCWPFALTSYKHAMRICHTMWRKLGWRPVPLSPLHLLSSTSFPLLHFFLFYFVTLQFFMALPWEGKACFIRSMHIVFPYLSHQDVPLDGLSR